MQVDDPVHEVEADEAHREDDARVLVDVGWRDAVELVDVLPGVDEVLGGGGRGFLVRTAAALPAASAAVDRALQRAPLAVSLRIVDFETHLLEQTSALTSTQERTDRNLAGI